MKLNPKFKEVLKAMSNLLLSGYTACDEIPTDECEGDCEHCIEKYLYVDTDSVSEMYLSDFLNVVSCDVRMEIMDFGQSGRMFKGYKHIIIRDYSEYLSRLVDYIYVKDDELIITLK